MSPDRYRRLTPDQVARVIARSNDSRNRRVAAERADRMDLARTLIRRYRARGLSYRQIAARTGVAWGTLWRIDTGQVSTVTRRTCDKLGAAMLRERRRR